VEAEVGAGTGAGAGAAKLGLLCADVAFWRAMLANVSRMFGTTAFGCSVGLLLEPSEAIRFGGGLPGGVVDSSTNRGSVRALCGLTFAILSCAGTGRSRVTALALWGGNILVPRGAFSFSLNELTMEAGKVWPFSQISTSFFIFSYEYHPCECASNMRAKKEV
jgi:hypothetical protein